MTSTSTPSTQSTIDPGSNCSTAPKQPKSKLKPPPRSQSKFNTTARKTARKTPATANANGKQLRKAVPRSFRGKKIHKLYGAPLKYYNPRRDAKQRASAKARHAGKNTEEIAAAVASAGKKKRRSKPGSITHQR